MTISRQFGAALLATIFCLLDPRAGSAQMGYVANSIEWLVAGADVVVRASVAEMSIEPAVPPERIARPLPRSWLIVTLKVHETIKGEPVESLQFAMLHYGSSRRPMTGREDLWFLSNNASYRKENIADPVEARYRLKEFEFTAPVLPLDRLLPAEKFAAFGPLIFDMKLNVLEDPKQILEAARASAAAIRGRGPIESYRINLHPIVMQWQGMRGDANVLVVPFDARLEALAREMILIPDQIVTQRGDSPAKREAQLEQDEYFRRRLSEAKTDEDRRNVGIARESMVKGVQDRLRAEGIRALELFKSEENDAILQRAREGRNAAGARE